MRTHRLLLVIAGCAGSVALTSAQAQSVNYLGSSGGNWVAYGGASAVPVLVTTTPGSITDATSAGSSFARYNLPEGGFSGLWKAGDTYRLEFDGVVVNATTFRLEFSSTGRNNGLQYVLVNGPAVGADRLEVNSFGAPSGLNLYTGNLGGASAAGTAQRVFGDLTFTVLSGATTAAVTGTFSDSTGVLWSASGDTAPIQSLGPTAASLFAALNVSSGGSATTINNLTWTYTAVPEPGTATLAALGLGLLAFRRATRKA